MALSVLSCEYDCVFGISMPTSGLTPPDLHRTFAEGWSFISIVGKGGKVYWFFCTKLDRKYHGSEIPRFKREDIDDHMAPYLNAPITDTVPFAEVYKRAIHKNWVPLEEALWKYWCIDRWACIGDSAHKVRSHWYNEYVSNWRKLSDIPQ